MGLLHKSLQWIFMASLEDAYKNAYQTLGWTHLSWNKLSNPPDTDAFSWSELDADQLAAADVLCYFEELWDTTPLYEWNNSLSTATTKPSSSPTPTHGPTSRPGSTEESTPTNSPSTTTIIPSQLIMDTNHPTPLILSALIFPTILPTTQLTIPIPYFRYKPWSSLNDDTRIFAILLKYTRENWDIPGTASIEQMSFDMIQSSNESRRIAYIQALGFGKSSWDCFMTHYTMYDWDQLSEHGVQQHYITLGWTEQLWNESDAQSTERLPWKDLSHTERIAAESLCYLEPIWNNVSLQDDSTWKVKQTSSSLRITWTARASVSIFTCIFFLLTV